MTESLGRREFIQALSLTGASLALPESARSGPRQNAIGDRGIANDYFRVSFDRSHGTFDVYRADGKPLLTGGTTGVNLASAGPGRASAIADAPIRKRSSAERYRHTILPDSFSDSLGSGKRMIVFSRDTGSEADLEVHFDLYDHLPAVTIETFCKNVSGGDLVVHSLEPLRAIKTEGGVLHVPGVARCITNGQMYFDTGILHEFGSKDGAITSRELKGVTLANGPIAAAGETVHSWWNAGLFSGYEKEGVALGYLDPTLGLGNLLMSKAADGQLSVLAESVYAPRILVGRGQVVRSNRLMITTAPNPYSALEAYAGAVGKALHGRTGFIVNGWCSWFYTLAQVTEEEVVANTGFAAKHLKQYGLEYIQIDEGFQRWHGDWEGNERFPHGMKWLASTIKSHGFKPGIWIAPYVVSEPTAVVQKHPEWLIKNPDGSPQRVGNWPANADPPADEDPRRYGLDITHPQAAEWLHALVDTIANDWGYEMIKIDFVAWSLLAARRFHDPRVSSAEAYRRGMEIMRRAAGDKCHILECGPGATTVGLIDSMRIELDSNYGFAEAAWDTYFLNPACSASAAGRRYYFHGRTWINDVDHLCTILLNNAQSEAAATIIALSGGNMMSGDRLTHLDPYKLDILKKITPASGQAAVPVDLFDSDIPSVFALTAKKPFGEWTVAAFFNASLTDTIEKTFSLSRLWLAPGRPYLAFDFWKQQFVGEVKDQITVRVQPGSVAVLSLRERLGHPQVISTDRHVLQGFVEIEDAQWDDATRTLSGVSLGPLHTRHNVSVYVPGEHPWTWGAYVLFRDYESYSLKLVHNNVIQVQVRFETSERVHWEIAVDEFFGSPGSPAVSHKMS
jgi:hypothetical protein